MKRNLFIIFISICVFAAIFFGINPIFIKEKPQEISLLAGTALPAQNILNEFTLRSTDNEAFTLNTLKGHWTLFYFGYADCPDICPRTLSLISDLYRVYPKNAQKPRFIFVSLDPSTDTIAKLKEFLGRFNPEFKGLTGQETEVQKLAKSCRVYSVTEPNLNAAGQKVIDHSSQVLLINPQGHLAAVFSAPLNPSDMAKDLEKLMGHKP